MCLGVAHMDTRYIWEFNAIVMHGSLSAAARGLNTTQPTLSKHLMSMEKELGVELIERKGGSQVLKLTPEGELFSKIGLEMINSWNELLRAFRGSETSERLMLGGSNPGIYLPFVSLLQNALETHGVPLNLTWAMTTKKLTIDALRAKTIDLALEPDISSEKLQHLRGDDLYGLDWQRLFTERAAVLLHYSDRLNKGDAVSFSQLANYGFLSRLSLDSSYLTLSAHGFCIDHGFTQRCKTYASYPSDLLMLAEHLQPGCVFLLPESMANQYVSELPFATVRRFEDSDLTYDFCMYYRTDDAHRLERLLSEASDLSGSYRSPSHP